VFAAQNMKVKMLNRLTRIRSGVCQKPESRTNDTFVLRDLNGQRDETRCNSWISCDEFDDVIEMRPRCDQDVGWRLWMQIAKRDRIFILGDKLSSKVAAKDPAKNTFFMKAHHSKILLLRVVGSATGTVE
jgi:hypothetical protein